jgi:hypothetical protein
LRRSSLLPVCLLLALFVLVPPRLFITLETAPNPEQPPSLTLLAPIAGGAGSDTGYAITLNWSSLNYPATTGYNLYVNGSQIGTAAASPFTFTGLNCGTTYTLGVQAHNNTGGTSQIYTTPYTTPPCVGSGTLANTTLPAIAWNLGETANTNIAGQTINVTAGQWSGAPTTFAYQWQDCNATASSCPNIPGETEPVYTLHASDAGSYIRAQVTATNASGSVTASSSVTGQVTASGGATYYVANTGSDTNNGTSKATPWQHAPGMTGCAGVCASHAFHAGDQIILKGGDSWDYAGTNGVAGLPWTWSPGGTWNGTGSARVYIGVDRSWYSGAAWARPKLNGDNPLSTGSPGSCTRPMTASSSLRQSGSYVTVDGLEFLGNCLTNNTTQLNVTVMDSGTSFSKFLNFYFHGWTVTSGSPQYGQNLAMINGSTGGTPPYPNNTNEFAYNIWDGSDSTPQSGTELYGDCYSFNHNYIRYGTNMVCNNAHLINDNVFEYINEDNSGGVDHGNTFEANVEANSDNYFYNNIDRHIGTISPIGVNWWIAPTAGFHDYMYNNVMYDVNGGGGANFLDCSGCSHLASFLNNTAVSDGNIASDPWGTVANNNFVITSGSRPPFTSAPTTIQTNYQDTPTNESQGGTGYTTTNQYAPTAAYHPTAGYATNKASLCSSLPDYCSDTTLAVGLSTAGGTDTLTYPARLSRTRQPSAAWDAGAYDYP